MASISFQGKGPVTLYCGTNFTALPVFYSSTRTATVVFKSDVLNMNSRVHFTYQIAGEPKTSCLWGRAASMQGLLELTPVNTSGFARVDTHPSEVRFNCDSDLI